MAERWAVANGNWSATATWNGGTLPAIDDDVYANNFTVTVDSNRTALTVRTTAGTTAVAGGVFNLSPGVTLTLTGSGSNVISNSANCVNFSGTTGQSATLVGNPLGATAGTGSRRGANNASTGTLNIIGNPTGGTSTANHGALNSSTGILNITGSPAPGSSGHGCINVSTGTMNITGNLVGASSGSLNAATYSNGSGTITGNVTGGSSSAAVTITGGSGTLAIIGNTIGGSGGGCNGVTNSSATATVTVSGDATGGSNATAYGASNTAAGILTVAGKAVSATGPGVFGSTTGTTTIGSAETGSLCINPTAGKVVFADLNTATYLIRNEATDPQTLRAGGLRLPRAMNGGYSA